MALLHTQVHIVSVESDKNWVEHLRSWKVIKDAEKAGRLEFALVNVGEVGAWGMPQEKFKNLFPNYSTQIFKRQNAFDVIFIDGRFRVACLLQSILHCPNAKILMHDFNNRAFYHQILEFVEIVDTCDMLAEFKIKKDVDKQRISALYEEYQYVRE